MELTKQNSYLKEYVLKCPICYELFSNIHKPLIIPCGHTICSSCVENLKKISAEDNEEDYSSDVNDGEYDLSMDSEEEEDNIEQPEVSEEEVGSDAGTSESSEESEEENDESTENEIVVENLNAPEINFEDYQFENLNKPYSSNKIPSDENLMTSHKKIKIKCSICRKRMKIFERDILVNMSVIKVIDYINANENIGLQKDLCLEGNSEEINVPKDYFESPPRKEEKSQVRDKRIFCKMCSFVDTENNHLNWSEEARNHKEHFAYLDDEEFVKIRKFYFDITDLNENSNADVINYKETINVEGESKSQPNHNENSNDINLLQNFDKIEISNETISGTPNNLNKPSTPTQYNKVFSKDQDENKIQKFSDFFNLNEINDLILTSFKLFFETLTRSNEFKNIANSYIKNYFIINSKAGYLKNKSFNKLTNLYEKFHEIMEELEKESDKSSEKAIFQKAENCIEAAEILCEKYFKILENYFRNYKKLGILAKADNFMENTDSLEMKKRDIYHADIDSYIDLRTIIDNTIKIKTIKLLKREFMSSYWNNLLECERRYSVSADNGSNQILLFDLRVQNELQVNYEKVFEGIKEEKNLSEEDLENLYTENVEIDEDGRFLFIIGKRNKPSKSFLCYDLLKRTLEKKKKLPMKFNMVDKYFYKNKLFIFGGSTENDNLSNNCYYYDVEADWWEELPSLNVGRTNKSITVFENKFYIFGGSSSSETEDLLTFEVLDLNKMGMGQNYFKWEAFKVNNYNTPVHSMLYGFVGKDILAIFGGEESSYYEENLKGFLINLSDKEEERRVIEEFKIKVSMINTNNPCSTLKGLIVGSQSGNDYFNKFDMRNNLRKLKHSF